MGLGADIKQEPQGGVKAGELWNQRLDTIMKFRKNHWNGDKTWKRMINMYKGQHWGEGAMMDDPDSFNAREQITVNLTGSTILNLLPFLIRRRPKFLVRPRGPKDVMSSRLKQEALNYNWRERDMQKQLKRATLDAAVIGHGVVKTGFELEVVASEEASRLRQQGRIEYRDYVKKDNPWIRRISPFLFFWDVESPDGDLDSARWAIEVIIRPIRDVVVDDSYSKTVRNKIRTGAENPTTIKSFLNLSKGEGSSLGIFKDEGDTEQDDRVVLFEVWDKRTGRYFVFAHGVNDPLREEKTWPYDYLEGFPYELLPFIPVNDEPYPIGQPLFSEDQQYELNRTRTAMFQHRRRFNRKYRVSPTVDESEAAKLENGEDGTIITAESGEIEPIMDAKMSSDVYNIESVIKQDMRELTGSDELIRGGQLPSRTTATEIGARQQLLGLKLEDRIDNVDTFVKRIGRKILQHMMANYTTEQVVRIVGPLGDFWVRFNVEDIQGEFDMDIESTSKKEVNEDTLRQQGIQILQISLNALQAGIQIPLDMVEMYKWLFELFPDMTDIGRFFGAANTPPANPDEAGNPLGGTPPGEPTVVGPAGLQQQLAAGTQGRQTSALAGAQNAGA